MKTLWIETKGGLYMQIIDPEPWVFELVEQSDEQKRTAAMAYIAKRYAETMDILTDPDTMAAIGKAESEDDTTAHNWENDGGAVHDR